MSKLRKAGLTTTILLVVVVSVWALNQGEGMTPLMHAAREGKTNEIKRLIADGAKLDQQSKYGWTALMFASWQGHLEAVELLLDAGADPNNVSQGVPSRFETVGGHPPSTALQEALRNGHLPIARRLLKAKAEIDPMAVAYAGGQGDIELLKELLAKGAVLNQPSNNAFYPSALCVAAQNGDTKMIRWLLTQGANPNLIAVEQTALKEAIEDDQLEAVRALIKGGADVNLVYGSMKEAPLFTAVTDSIFNDGYDANLAIIKLLLAHGADLEYKPYLGEHTALDVIKIQRTNTRSYLTPDVIPEGRKRLKRAIAHQDTVIELLEEATKKAQKESAK